MAVGAVEDGNEDIWIHEVARALKRRLTFHPAREQRPVWSPEGDKITFASNRKGEHDIFTKPADGTGEAAELLATPLDEYSYDWSSDGKFLIYDKVGDEGGMNIWYLRPKEDDSGYEEVSFVKTPFDELSLDLSPDGRFLAYESNESGEYEVYVMPFPEGGGKWQVSTKGGRQPRWRKDGKELFYGQGDTLVAVSVTTTPTFSVGATKPLFEAKGIFDLRGHQYDVSADGQRFVMVERLEQASSSVIRVVQNWFEEFRERQN
ncbi:hypothetical protein MYX65_11435 [Acidobacteria bacterium AH-259-L09]|nr:hypothetical protein [Acidobacteria bacterium AH-259-L09]